LTGCPKDRGGGKRIGWGSRLQRGEEKRKETSSHLIVGESAYRRGGGAEKGFSSAAIRIRLGRRKNAKASF